MRCFSLYELLEQTDLVFDPLHVSLIQTNNETQEVSYLPKFPGIPDTHYITEKSAGKGMITKREVRLSILSSIQPSNNDVIWDVGAACGGVSVKLAYWNEKATVYSIEDNKQHLACLEQNRQQFGVVKNLHITL